jgi:hypothetical protein
MSEKCQKRYGRSKRSIRYTALRHLSTPYHSEKILERIYYPPDSQNTAMGVMDTLIACVLSPFAPPSHSLSRTFLTSWSHSINISFAPYVPPLSPPISGSCLWGQAIHCQISIYDDTGTMERIESIAQLMQSNMNTDAMRCGTARCGGMRCGAVRCGDNCWVSTHRVNRELRLCPVV